LTCRIGPFPCEMQIVGSGLVQGLNSMSPFLPQCNCNHCPTLLAVSLMCIPKTVTPNLLSLIKGSCVNLYINLSGHSITKSDKRGSMYVFIQPNVTKCTCILLQKFCYNDMKVQLTACHHLVPNSRIHGALPPCPLYSLMA
jgi:hypothetical protein